MGDREIKDQRARRVVLVLSRQYDKILDLEVTSIVSDSRGDFVCLYAVPSGGKKGT